MKLEEQMKAFERIETAHALNGDQPVIARLDGRSFSRFTKGLTRPYDQTFRKLMIETAAYLLESSQARVAFTQSDEISLLFSRSSDVSQIFFAGRVQKMVSVLASLATARFNQGWWESGLGDELACFDCRVFEVPEQESARKYFIWRQQDGIRNSIQMLAREHFSEKELSHCSQTMMLKMLQTKGINWMDWPARYRSGTLIQRRQVQRRFTPEEITQLPPKHLARQNPDLIVLRTEQVHIESDQTISSYVNGIDALFEGAVPITGA